MKTLKTLLLLAVCYSLLALTACEAVVERPERPDVVQPQPQVIRTEPYAVK
jgi:hypothetical protein